MSALARYFKSQGKNVSGYDRSPTTLTDALQKEGIDVHFEDDVSRIPQNIDLVIYTPAIPNDLNEFVYLKKLNIPVKKRAEILGLLTSEKNTVAVAGTHGKTTVSTMTAHILTHVATGCSALLGGIAKNYHSNVILNNDSEFMVVEADEYDRSFLQLHPNFAVITAMDADHLDIYDNHNNLKESFIQFIQGIDKKGKLLMKATLSEALSVNSNPVETYSYSLDGPADFYAEKVVLIDGLYNFNLCTPKGKVNDLSLGMPGLINVENAVAASAIALLAGAKDDEIRTSLRTFSGIHRRFDYQINRTDLVFIDDYAHHPEEITRFVHSVRGLYPGKKILGVFQPHLYSRTRDFASEFAKSLDLLDEIILLPIYPAREKPIDGVKSEIILDQIFSKRKSIVANENLLAEIDQRSFDILLTIGAGDIDKLVEPIKKHLIHKNPAAR